MVWRRRARWKSSSTSARGKPVSGIATTGEQLSQADARLDPEQVPSGDVAYRGAAQPTPPNGRAVGMHVTMQQRHRLERGDQAGQRPEPAVRRVVAVADTPWRRVGEHYVDPAAVPPPAPPRPASQRPGPPGLLPVGVLVR